ncbi:MAG: histidinol dehydrogenase [Candidatus Aminicenantes bacterium]|nr:histidinol dehydrogenase [Candidatus Aminicenantes bacterium]
MNIIGKDELPADFFAGFRREDVPGVRRIVEDVKRDGDAAVRHYSRLLDGVAPDPVRATKDALDEACKTLDPSLRDALRLAARNIRAFAEAQKAEVRVFEVETSPGVFCGQRPTPVERVGVYVPGGRHPLVSSLLMGAIPALAAGVREIAVCSPPTAGGSVHPVILGAAGLLGLNEIYAVGGAQAVAAMAYGTESIRRVDKIIGPGNRFVTAAKLEIFGAAGIDLPAGPSEVLVVAGGEADPETVAADLLAQAEHDPEASAVLLTDSRRFAESVDEAVRRGLERLTAPETAARSLDERGFLVVLDALEEAVEIANRRAPEHLELQGERAVSMAERFRNFGALFLGAGAGEVFGDYAAGTNHILPTGGTARFSSGLGVRDFIKFQSTLRFADGAESGLVSGTVLLAETEGLAAHAAAARLRGRTRPG